MSGAIRRELRRRRPHLLAAAVALGLALAQCGPLAVTAGALFATAIAAFAFGREGVVVACTLVAGAGAFGSWRIESIDRPAKAAPAGSLIDAEATLLERPRKGLFGSSAVMRVESGPAKDLRILAKRREHEWPSMDPGARFRIRGVVRSDAPAGSASSPGSAREDGSANSAGSPAGASALVPSDANAGVEGTPGFGPLPAADSAGDDFDYAAFLRSRGIGRQVQVESLKPIGRRGGFAGAIDSIRRRAERGISAGLADDRGALARGMVLGEDGDVAEATRDDFRRSGLAHLMAASGQNVALLCALALPLLIALGTTPRARVSVLLPLVGLYVALAGSGASIVRAGIMASAALVALAASRRSSAIYALLLAAVITLAVNPRSTGDPGWQFSFAAVIGMFVLGGRIARRLEFLPHFAREAIGATVAATLVTAPLLAHQFGAISIAALPANLIVFPVVAPIMWIGMAEAAAEQAAAMSPVLAMVVHLGESAVAPIQALALRWVAAVATHFADPAWAQAQIHWSWPQVAVAYALIALACVWAAHGGSARRVASAAIRVVAARPSTPGPSGTRPSTPGPSAPALIGPLRDWIRALSPASRRAYAAPVIALAFGAAALASTPPRAPDHLTVDFLDVGQGDSVLIRDPAGAAVLFDGGVPEARVDRTLRRLGVRRLSVVVATHQSRDHHAGLLQVVKRFPVGLFLDGRDGVDDPTFIALEREVDRRRIPRRPTRAGQRFHVGDLTIRILWPTPRTAATPRGDPNERATVAIVSEGEFDLLLSADAEAPVLLPLNLPPVEAMKVPHHGSVEDGLPELLRRLRPRVAAIETGRGNRYGHPRPQTLQALRAIPRVYRTDRDGTVELTVTGDQIAIRTHR